MCLAWLASVLAILFSCCFYFCIEVSKPEWAAMLSFGIAQGYDDSLVLILKIS